MPIYESYCADCQTVKEWYAKHFIDIHENPPCEVCAGPTARLLSRFGVVFTGALTTKYNDRSIENAHQEGHWAYRVRSSRTGHPEPVYIENFDQQRRFCKEEGLVNPKDMPTNVTGSEDGKSLGSTGMPGQWV